jgi:hypothetical protein
VKVPSASPNYRAATPACRKFHISLQVDKDKFCSLENMLFTIVENFGVADGEPWSSYIEWRGIHFDRFDSLDGILRKSLFTPESEEDWSHVVCENFKLSYLTDFSHAHQTHVRMGIGSLMGFAYTEHDEANEGFLGYDIIDRFCDVSLLTNWGNDVEIVNHAIGSNALVPTLAQVERIHEFLTSNHGDDNHVKDCRIVSVYSTGHLKKQAGKQVSP